MSKVTHMRQALHQILADEAVPTTTTALILAEHDVTSADVMVACDVLEDAVAEFRGRENAAMSGERPMSVAPPLPSAPTPTATAPSTGSDLRRAIDANRAKALASISGGPDEA